MSEYTPTTDEREELAKVIRDRAAWPSLHWPPLAPLQHRDVLLAIADAILAAGFRRLEAQPAPDWEHGQLRYYLDGWEPYERFDKDRYVVPCVPDARGDIVRRRSAGPWEPVPDTRSNDE